LKYFFWKNSFEFWNENFYFWNLNENWSYHQRGMEKIWNKKIIYFVYATMKKLPITSLYNLCIAPYTTC
jgi:predicted chitinase